MAYMDKKTQDGKKIQHAHNKIAGTQHAEKSITALREEEILTWWKDARIFEKSLEKIAPNGEFVFYDGPPFATGLPHMGHLLGSAIKDVAGRYKTMCGYRVERTWGWDTHGLPIEHMIEKKLELKTKKDVEAMGIDRFNEEARSAVLAFTGEWKRYVERIGRWVDFDHSYKTMDNSYIESVWWALKKIYDDGRLYEWRKVLMYCPRCETPLSKAEIAMDNSYKDVTDTAVYVAFKVTGTEFCAQGAQLPTDASVYLLAWTTTPWTLPANMALAVGADIEYVLVAHADIPADENVRDSNVVGLVPSASVAQRYFIVAKDRLRETMRTTDAPVVLRTFKGSDLVGLSYEPLYTIAKANAVESEKALTWTVLPADFVTTDEGTGVVHIAPMYGEDDYALGVQHGLPSIPLLDATGTYNADAPELVRGMFYKKGGKYILEDLKARGHVLHTHDHSHSYPHCYRCGTALLYNAMTSWFINIQSVKKRLLEANEEVSWYPAHLKHGRFKHIVEGAPDWTISRNRFWASPLPIWRHERTGEVTVLGSLAEVRAHTRRSGNTYLVVRHGQAESNVRKVISALADDKNHLTEMGKEQAHKVASSLKGKGVARIIASPFVRTRETAECIAKELGIPVADIVYDARIGEWGITAFHGKPLGALSEACPTYHDRFTHSCGGESLMEMKQRVGDALYAYENTYAGETILIVGHEYTAWMAECVAQGATLEECVTIRGVKDDFIANGEVRVLDFVPLPHNKAYELDFHRPYIDEISLIAPDGGRLVRIPEVVDCWVESGLMPIASQHVLGDAMEKPARYPGDFIAEYIAQTRTWFYYMHAMGVLLFDGPSFTQCVATGTILAEDGSKMSKSKNNFTDPLINLDRFGADALRLYILGSVVMQSEDMHFRDEELKEVHNRIIGMLWNSYKFYELYASEKTADIPMDSQKRHALDRWILARLAQVVDEVTGYMEEYDTVRTVRTIRDFISDFSTWYIRRSRDRFKSDDVVDRGFAIETTRHVLQTIAKLLAPTAPFIAESVYRGTGGEKESVHLEQWPMPLVRDGEQESLLLGMKEVRRVASLALEARQRAGIKVRQPLASLTIKSTQLEGKSELLQLLADEVNVKQVICNDECESEVLLDSTITEELRREGATRDIVRSVQELRKQAGLAPEQTVTLSVCAHDIGHNAIEIARAELARVAGVSDIVYGDAPVAGVTVEVEGDTLTLAISVI